MTTAWPDFQRSAPAQPGWGAPPANVGSAAIPSPLATPKAKRQRLRLKTGAQVRLEIGRVYKMMKTGDLEPARGTKLIYALEVLSRAIEREKVEQLTDRLDAAEGK